MTDLSPLEWVSKLEQTLIIRRGQMETMERYHSGDHPLPFLTPAHQDKMRSEFLRLLKSSRSNFMRLVCDAVVERLCVEGFRLSAEADATADKDMWAIWQANQMDADHQTAIEEALIKGVSYLSVWKDAGDRYPTIAVEDPMQTIVAYTAGSNFHRREAALKMFTDEWTGDLRANLYLPGAIWKFARPAVAAISPSMGTSAGLREQVLPWTPLGDPDGFVPNPWGIVPIIPLRNRGRLLLEGESEIGDIVPIQDRINGELFMRALAGYFGAHKQRWVTGLKIMQDDDGNDVEPFDIAIDKMLQTEDPEVRFGEFSQTDLAGYISAIEQDVLHIAVTTRTPRHYLIESGQSPSGDAIRSAESGLVRKANRKKGPFGEGFEQAMGLARLMAGLGEMPIDAEIVWQDSETRTDAERTDAAIKRFQAGIVPLEATLEDLGYTQTAIQRFAGMRAKDTLLRALMEPAPSDFAAPGGQTLSPDQVQQSHTEEA